MAKRNLEDELLAGASKLSLIAKDYTSEEIDKTAEEIEKKNPNETASFRERLGLIRRKNTESPSVEPSSESPSASPQPQVQDLLSDLEGATGPRLELGSVKESLGVPDPEDNLGLKVTTKTSTPIKESKNYESWINGEIPSDDFVFKALEEDTDFQDLMSGYDADIAEMEKKLEERFFPSFQTIEQQEAQSPLSDLTPEQRAGIPYPTPKEYTEYKTVEEQIADAQQELKDLKMQRFRAQLVETQKKRGEMLSAKWREANPEPPKYSLESLSVEDETEEWESWVSRARKVESEMYTKYGVVMDIDEDTVIGKYKPGSDLGVSLGLGLLTAFDLFVYTAGGIGDLSEVVDNKTVVNYAKNSTALRKALNSFGTQWETNFGEDYITKDLDLDKGFGYATQVFKDVVDNSSYMILAYVASAYTQNPAAAPAALSAVSAFREYYMASMEPGFDTFYDSRGNVIDPNVPENYQLFGDIRRFYEDPKKNLVEQDGEKFLALPNGTVLRVEQDDDARTQYSIWKGITEGGPEALAMSSLIKGVRAIGSGTMRPLRSVTEGYLRAAGIGATAEGVQELTTALAQVLVDEKYLEKGLSASEVMAQAIQAIVTGAAAGGPFAGVALHFELRGGKLVALKTSIDLNNNLTESQKIPALIDVDEVSSINEMRDKIENDETLTQEDRQVMEEEVAAKEAAMDERVQSARERILELTKTDPAASRQLFELMSELNNLNATLEGGNLTDTGAKAIVADRAKAARDRINTLLGQMETGSQIQQLAEEIVQESEQSTEDFAMSAEQIAELTNLTVEQAQQLLDNPNLQASAAYAAAALSGDVDDVITYADRDAFLADAPEGKAKSLAYFDKNTGKIHISPEASAIDVFEEAIHLQIQDDGYDEEQIDEMGKKLLESENPLVKAAAEKRNEEYEGDMEEVVAGVLRGVRGVDFGDKNLNSLSDKLSSRFPVQEQAAVASPSMTQERYDAVSSQMVQAGLSNLQVRSDSFGLDVNSLAQELGFDPSTMTLDQLETLEKEYFQRVPVLIGGTISQDADLQNPTTKSLYDFLESKGLIENGVPMYTNLPMIIMSVDELGNVDFDGTTFYSGIDAEKMRVDAPGQFSQLLAGTNPSTAGRMRNSIERLASENGRGNREFLILYKIMGSKATESSEIYTMASVRSLRDLVGDGAPSRKQADTLLAAIHSVEEREPGGWVIRIADQVNGEINNKTAEYASFNTLKEAEAFIAKVNRENKAEEDRIKNLPESEQGTQKDVKKETVVLTQPVQDQRPLWLPTELYEHYDNLSKTSSSVASRAESYREILAFLSDPTNVGVFTDNLNIKERSRFNAALGADVDVDSMRAKGLPENAEGQIVAAAVGSLGSDRRAKKINLGKGQSQYEYGVTVENATMEMLSSPFNYKDLNFVTKPEGQKKQLYNNEIVEMLIIEEANKDRESSDQYAGDSTMDAIMGLPDGEFKVYYTEESGRSFYDNDLFVQMQRSKTFNDGWHFWNWWVQQTGNGTLKGGLMGFAYTDPVTGEFKKIENIPTKKDRETREPLKVEPKFRSLTRKRIDSQFEEAKSKQQASEELRRNTQQKEQDLKDRLEGGDLSFGLLQGAVIGQYGNNPVSDSGRASLIESMENLHSTLMQSREMQVGDVIQFAGHSVGNTQYTPIPSEQLEGTTTIELASREVKRDNLRADDPSKFFGRYEVLPYHNDNIVHSIEKTEDGYKMTVGLNISNSNQELIDAIQGKEIPKSKSGLIELVKSYKVPDETQEARIMPPRYYDLKQQRGSWTGTVDFMNGWLVNKYADILGFEKEQEQLRGSRLPQSQRFSEVEQLMYGKARYAMEQLDNTMQTAKDFMIENGISHQDLSQFMYALHAQERNEQIQKKRPSLLDGSGMSTERAMEIIDELDSPQMRQAAQFFYDIINDTRKTMADKGLEPLDKLDAWEQLYTSYVPLQGFAEDELDPGGNAYPTGGAGMAVYGSKVKKAIGRESEAANVLANIVMQNAVTHQWAEKNVVLTSLHDMIVKNEMMEDVWSVVDNKKPLTKLDENGNQVPMTIMEMQADAHTVPVRIDGEQKFLYFNDPYYADVLNGMTMEQTNTFLRAMRAPVSWLRGVFTQWDPNFFVSNFARDIGGSIYNAAADVEGGFFDNIDQKGFQKKMMSNSFKALNALLGESVRGKQLPPEMQQFYDEWKEDGGQTGWNFVKDLKDIEAQLATNVDDLTRGKELREKLFSSPKRFFEFVEGVNDSFENSIRVSAYMTARQQGASRQQAAVFSKNITVNFNRQGEAGPAINTMYLFFNAAIQGNMRFVDAMTTMKPIHKPDGSTRQWYERATGAQKVAAGMAGFSGMLTLLNLAMSGVDEEDGELWYNKMSEYDKQRNMIICYGPGRDDFLKIPLPYGYGLFNNAGLALAEVSTGNRSMDEAMLYLGTTAFTSFSPISFGGEIDNPGTFVTRSLLPTTLKPFAEMAENRTYFGSQITGEQLPYGTPVPSSELQYRSPEQVQKFFRWMNEATGGSQFKSGWADFNPDYTYYMFEYLIGGSGDFVLSTGEQARNLFEMSKRAAEGMEGAKSLSDIAAGLQSGFGEEGEVKINYSDVPIVKKVYGEASPFYDIDKFKQQSTEVEQLFREYKERVIVQDPGRYKGVQQLHKEYLEANKTLKAIRKSLREAREIPDYIERQNRITLLYENQRRVMARWNRRYKELRGQD